MGVQLQNQTVVSGRSSALLQSPEGGPRALSASDSSYAGALRISLHGASDQERATLVAILQILKGRTARCWALADAAGPADLCLTKRGEALNGDGLMALMLREDERSAGPDELALQTPMRVMAVLDLLNAADDRLRHVASGDEHTAISVRADDGRSLAAALARLLERRAEPTLRVRIVGHGTLYVCLKARIHHCDFPPSQLVAALNEHRFVMTALPAAAAELVLLRESARQVDEVLWHTGLVTPSTNSYAGGRTYRLKRWPDFARLSHRPAHVRLCALMSKTPQRLESLASASGLSSCEVEHFLHACELCGWLDVVDTGAVSNQSGTPTRAVVASGNLFDRLRRRFGL